MSSRPPSAAPHLRCHMHALPGRCLSVAPSTPHRPTSSTGAASQPADPRSKAVLAHAASPLSGLAQHVPGTPRHPEAGLTPMLHSTRHQGAAADDDCSRSRLGLLLSFPALRTRAAGHHPPRPTHIASRLAQAVAGSLHPGPLASASSPRAVHLSTRHVHRRNSRGPPPGEWARWPGAASTTQLAEQEEANHVA